MKKKFGGVALGMKLWFLDIWVGSGSSDSLCEHEV